MDSPYVISTWARLILKSLEERAEKGLNFQQLYCFVFCSVDW